tara:strand:- start:4296 stop:7481 length:3186 start_codon:yes stop_codon:yes gene_type:complete
MASRWDEISEEAARLGLHGKEAMAWIREKLESAGRKRAETIEKSLPGTEATREEHGQTPVPFTKGHRGKLTKARVNFTAALKGISRQYVDQFGPIVINKRRRSAGREVPAGVSSRLEGAITRAYNEYMNEVRYLDPWLSTDVLPEHRKLVADMNKIVGTRITLPVSRRDHSEELPSEPGFWKALFRLKDNSYLIKQYPYPEFVTDKDVIKEIERVVMDGAKFISLASPTEIVHEVDRQLHGRSPLNTMRNLWRTFSDSVYKYLEWNDINRLENTENSDELWRNPEDAVRPTDEKRLELRIVENDWGPEKSVELELVDPIGPGNHPVSYAAAQGAIYPDEPKILVIENIVSAGISHWRKWLPEVKRRLGIREIKGYRTTGAKSRSESGLQWLKFSDSVHNFAFLDREAIDQQLQEWSRNLDGIQNVYETNLRVVKRFAKAMSNQSPEDALKFLEHVKNTAYLPTALNNVMQIAQMALDSFGANISDSKLDEINERIADLDDTHKEMAMELQHVSYGKMPIQNPDGSGAMIVQHGKFLREGPKGLKKPLSDRGMFYSDPLLQPVRREQMTAGPSEWSKWKFDLLDRDEPKGSYIPGSVTVESFPGRKEVELMDIEFPSHLSGPQPPSFYKKAMAQLKNWMHSADVLSGRRKSHTGAKIKNLSRTSKGWEAKGMKGFPDTTSRVKFSEEVHHFGLREVLNDVMAGLEDSVQDGMSKLNQLTDAERKALEKRNRRIENMRSLLDHYDDLSPEGKKEFWTANALHVTKAGAAATGVATLAQMLTTGLFSEEVYHFSIANVIDEYVRSVKQLTVELARKREELEDQLYEPNSLRSYRKRILGDQSLYYYIIETATNIYRDLEDTQSLMFGKLMDVLENAGLTDDTNRSGLNLSRQDERAIEAANKDWEEELADMENIVEDEKWNEELTFSAWDVPHGQKIIKGDVDVAGHVQGASKALLEEAIKVEHHRFDMIDAAIYDSDQNQASLIIERLKDYINDAYDKIRPHVEKLDLLIGDIDILRVDQDPLEEFRQLVAITNKWDAELNSRYIERHVGQQRELRNHQEVSA